MADAKQKTRKLDLDKAEDVNALCAELLLVDPGGELINQLQQVLLARAIEDSIKGQNPSVNTIVPFYVRVLKSQRQKCLDIASGLERVIQILEEGI